jgi:iron complex outermembrane receptor protein
MRTNLFIGAAAIALVMPAAAMAQSTGTADAEAKDVVVTGARGDGSVDGIEQPNTPKARGVLTQEYISHQAPGQSINEIINQLPGVSFQNNDPFGSAGGTINIRGFDGSRISQTFDGVPLNDTGNYAIYSNQQLDPEVIDRVNVNLGTTDVDNPSASATGSTINYRSVNPTEEFGVRMVSSYGDDKYFRVFGVVNTGNLNASGTRAWLSASHATNNWFVNDFGKVNKQQYNGKIYQPLNDKGDFISLIGNYNQNRNNFAGSAPLRSDLYNLSQSTTAPFSANNPGLVTGAARVPGTGTTNRFPSGFNEIPYHVARCSTATPNGAAADTANTCGTSYDERYNPSNTATIHLAARVTPFDKLVVTVDPYFEYTKANGGGTVTGREGSYVRPASTGVAAITTPQYGFIGGSYYFGRDLNGDGDTRDTVTLLAPSQTETHRYGILGSVRYDFSPSQSLFVGYSHDYGRHRQTGEAGYLQPNGVPFDVFPVNNPIVATNGVAVQKRDRLSYAIVDVFSGEYRGHFFDDRLNLNLGVRAPFEKRVLNNFCFTTAANGNVDCLGRGQDALNAAYALANPYNYNAATNTPSGYAAPSSRTVTYHNVLPNVGLTFRVVDRVSLYASYSKGVQVPGTDNLYQGFYYPAGTIQAKPVQETSDNFDAGVRYNSGRIQAFVGGWYTRFSNRLASAFDPDTQVTIYRNLGRVDKYGVDGSIAYSPFRDLKLYAFGSYLHSEIKNNVQAGNCPTVLTAANTTVNCSTAGAPIFFATAGKRESGAPVYTAGGRVQYSYGPVTLGSDIKRTGKRYLNDQNLAAMGCTAALVNFICPTAANTTAAYTGTRGFAYYSYGAAAPGYTTVNFDARIDASVVGLTNKTYVQLNLLNAFSQFYAGGYTGGSTTQFNNPFANIAYPRTFIASLNVAF